MRTVHRVNANVYFVFQARRQEMKWGEVCKKVDLSATHGALCTVSVSFYFTLYLFGGGVRTPLPTGLYLTGYRHRGELGSLVLNTCIAVGVHTEVHCELQFSSCAVIRRLLCVPITALKRRSRKRMVVERRFCGLHVWTVIMIWHKVNLPVTRFSVNTERRGFLRDNLASYSTDGSVAC